MSDQPTDDGLPGQVLLGVSALRAGRPRKAVDALLPVAEDAELAADETLRDIYARVCSLLAQSYIESGRPEASLRWIRQAMRQLRTLDDKDGIGQVKALQDQAVAALAERTEWAGAHEHQQVAATPMATLLDAARTPDERADAYLKKAGAELSLRQLDRARSYAQEALQIGETEGSARAHVFALLMLARIEPDGAEPHLLQALARADEANEFNLVSAIATAARHAGVELPSIEGPQRTDGKPQ